MTNNPLLSAPRAFVTASFALTLAVTGCGGQLADQAGVDESEMDGVQISANLAVGESATIYNTGGVGLNLRKGPGTGYGVWVTMPEGAKVKVTGNAQNSFYKVTYNSREGWAHQSYLQPISTGGGTGGGKYPTGIKWDAASSQNFTSTRQGSGINYVIIHDMEGNYGGAISWFKNPASQVSAHYCIRSSDGDITQMVREQDIAWHAGSWNYNKAGIGIEHEGWASQASRWYTETMYRRSAQLTAAITKRYGIAVDRTHIIGHAEVPPPNTHTDPGTGWDWNKYISLIKSYR